MTERIPSDHATVDSHRVELGAVGRTGRAQLPLPDAVDCTAGDPIQLSVGGDRLFAVPESTLGDDLVVRGAYANRRVARERSGTDRLSEWLDETGHGPGSTLLLDVVTPGYAFGLREPGTRTVYEATDPPTDSLSDIAESLDG